MKQFPYGLGKVSFGCVAVGVGFSACHELFERKEAAYAALKGDSQYLIVAGEELAAFGFLAAVTGAFAFGHGG